MFSPRTPAGSRQIRTRAVLLTATVFASVPVIADSAVARTTGEKAVASGQRAHAKAVRGTHATKAAPAARTAAAPTAQPQQLTAQSIAPSAIRRQKASTLQQSYRSAGTEEVVVTGSMLRSGKNTNPNPVQTITATQIQQSGSATLGDFLQRMPSMGSSGTTNNQTNGGGGSSCMDIRNLGQNRVLVLIDGKRTTMNGNNNCVDFNTIPTDMVQDVEILKDGGSELYGADAVSGVINIKLRHNITDGKVTAYGGVSGQGDALTGKLSAHKGWNFDHDKGNFTIFGSYMTEGGIMQRDRSWARDVANNNPASGTPSYGSSIASSGHFFGLDSGNEYTGTSSGQLTPWTSRNRYNFARDRMLSNYLQNSSVRGDLHYEINEHFIPYANVLYSHRTSMTQMAAEPVVGAVPPSDMPAGLIIPANDPYNTTGEDLQMYKRMTEFGPRKKETASDTVTGMGGMRGEITHGWMYDASYTYGSNMMTEQQSGVGNYQNLLNTYGIRQVDPSDTNSALVYDPSVCNAAAGCVLSNPMAPLSRDAADYANYTASSHYHYQMRDLNVRINNNRVVKMPWKNGGDFAVALGMEHRGEQLSYNPDPLIESGKSLTNTSKYTGGGFDVTEGYLEGKITLLQNAFLAKNLTIDGQGRFSSYNTFGNAKTWKAAINWSPTRDIRFHATLGTSFRQPNVYELYGGQQMSYLTATDPCAQAATYGAYAGVVSENCARQGINTKTFQDVNAGQIPTLTGGNSKLRPETSRTWTVGADITPRWIPGLHAGATLWHYNIANLISATSSQYIVDQCYTGQNTAYCNQIQRFTSSHQIDYTESYDINQGGMHESGIDWDVEYSFRLSPRDRMTITTDFQQLLNYKQQMTAGGPWTKYTGALAYNDGVGYPKVRDYTTATWRHGNFHITYMLTVTGGMRWNDSTNFLQANGQARYKTPAMFKNDISMGYDLGRWSFEGGINNINNKKPPYVVSASDNSIASVYGDFYEGRSFWLQVSAGF